jgi:hypothetical protein
MHRRDRPAARGLGSDVARYQPMPGAREAAIGEQREQILREYLMMTDHDRHCARRRVCAFWDEAAALSQMLPEGIRPGEGTYLTGEGVALVPRSGRGYAESQ